VEAVLGVSDGSETSGKSKKQVTAVSCLTGTIDFILVYVSGGLGQKRKGLYTTCPCRSVVEV